MGFHILGNDTDEYGTEHKGYIYDELFGSEDPSPYFFEHIFLKDRIL